MPDEPSPTHSLQPDAPARDTEPDPASFSQQAEEQDPGLIIEFLEFLRDNKKWWLIPILFVLGLLGALTYYGSTAAPFIYPLF